MPQRTFDDGFYHASRARDIAAGNGAANTNVLSEINAIQLDVDAACKARELMVEVEGTTNMTTADDYNGVGTSSHYDAWNDLDQAIKSSPAEESALRLAQVEMDRVIAYFTRLGYTIRREQSGFANLIKWVVKW